MTHTSEKLDYTIVAAIVHSNKILLIYNTQYQAWFHPGGHIEKDEDLEEALFREVKEETGFGKEDLTIIDIRNSIPKDNIFSDTFGRSIITPAFTDAHRTSPTHMHIGFRYFLKVTKNKKMTSVDECVKKHRWFTEKDLYNPRFKLKKHVIWYSKFALDNIK